MNIEWSDELICGIHDEFRCQAVVKLGSIIGNYDKIGDVIALHLMINGLDYVNKKPTRYQLIIRSKHDNGFPIYVEKEIWSMDNAKKIAHDKVLELVGSFIEEVQCNMYSQGE